MNKLLKLRSSINYFLDNLYAIKPDCKKGSEEKMLSDQQCLDKFKKDYPPEHIESKD